MVVFGRILHRNVKLLDHDQKIALGDGVDAPVDEDRLLAVILKVCVECEARCECVGIRVVVALDNYVIIF